ncbi:undecaprenyl-diphosphate phosphatase [Candidatus Nomurabacteria bacterium]|nr:undecaprenyl-diphosphate phosphatase [Candidatus Nomurabacteria bacterium]
MIQSLILGFIQGIAEWLPVSSEAILVLVNTHFFGGVFFDSVQYALFLHLGTVLAAVIYFWKDIVKLLRQLPTWFKSTEKKNPDITFYIVATGISVIIAAFFVLIMKRVGELPITSTRIMTLGIGALLLVTAFLQWFSRSGSGPEKADATLVDALIAGVGQGLAALPGISRSGTTVAFLLLRNIQAKKALELSFIMSIPFVLIGNIALNIGSTVWTWSGFVGLIVACIVGLASIHLFLKAVEKVNFAWVVCVFGLLVIVGGFLL